MKTFGFDAVLRMPLTTVTSPVKALAEFEKLTMPAVLTLIDVTFEPTMPLRVVMPELVPMKFSVPALLTVPVLANVMPLVDEPELSIVRLLLPVMAPLNVGLKLPLLPMVNVPVVVGAKVMALAIVAVTPPSNEAFAFVAASPKVTAPVPRPAAAPAMTVPFLIAAPPLNVFTPFNATVPEPVFVRLMPTPETIPLTVNVEPGSVTFQV